MRLFTLLISNIITNIVKKIYNEYDKFINMYVLKNILLSYVIVGINIYILFLLRDVFLFVLKSIICLLAIIILIHYSLNIYIIKNGNHETLACLIFRILGIQINHQNESNKNESNKNESSFVVVDKSDSKSDSEFEFVIVDELVSC